MLNTASGILLLSCFAAGLSIALNLFPYSALHSVVVLQQGSLFDLLKLIVGAGAVPISLLLYWLLRQASYRKNASLITGCTPFDPIHDFDLQSLQTLQPQSLQFVTFMMRGDHTTYVDDGRPLVSSPAHFKVQIAGKTTQSVIVFPAAVLARLSKTPKALAAVVWHELAHVKNRDIDLLYGTAGLLRVISVLALGVVALNVASSVRADTAGATFSISEIAVAIWAALIGNSYALTAVLLAALSLLATRAMHQWREALADRAASDALGPDAISEAERLIAGNTEYSGARSTVGVSRVNVRRRQQAIRGTPWLYSMFGMSMGALSSFLAGPFAYLANQTNYFSEFVQQILLYAAEAIISLIVLATLWVSVRLASQKSVHMSFIPFPLIAAAGFVAGHMFFQVLPLVATSVGMPEGFDNVLRHEPWPLVLRSLYDQFSFVCGFLLLVVSVAVLRLSSIWWVVPGVAWALISPSDSACFWPGDATGAGLVSPLLVLMFVTLLSANVFATVSSLYRALAIICFVSGTLLLSVFGTEPHLARLHLDCGYQKLDASDYPAAEAHYSTAAWLAPFGETAWWSIANLRHTTDGATSQAIEAMEKAAQAPLVSNWNTRFAILGDLANLYLERRSSGDIERSLEQYSRARDIWLNNSRLDSKAVINHCYNHSAALALHAESHSASEALSFLHLTQCHFEAKRLGYANNLVEEAAGDSDFSTLNLRHNLGTRPVAAEELGIILQQSGFSGLEGWLADRPARQDELIDFLRLLLIM